jgi:hypothetical protein
MSIFIQEVLNLLQRKQDKKELQLKRDWFEFGRTKSSFLGKSSYAPKMDHYTIRFDDLKCEIISGLVGGTGTEHTLPVWSTIDINNCKVQTIVDSIFSQNAVATEGLVSGDFRVTGNTLLEQNLQVNQNANIDLQLTAGSANIKDLTEDRIVIVGLNGELEDDANFTFDGTTFNIGQGNFTVDVTTGNTQIIGTLNVDDQATFASANVEDLTEDRLVIAGPNGELEDSPNLTFDGNELTTTSLTVTDLTEDRVVIVGENGELEDDSNFTMDGTTFTANVNVIHGTDVPGGVPTHTTTINSNLELKGPIYDSQGNIGQLSQVLVGLGDGRVIWSDDDVVEALTYGSLWQGNVNNLKQELTIGSADQILISDGITFSWQNNPAAIVGEVCAVNSIPLWTPNSNTLGCSLIYQDGNSSTPATKIFLKGGLASETSQVRTITDVALGYGNYAGGENSAAFNFRSSALGNDSFALGHRTIAGGHGSFVAGYNSGAGNYGFGYFNATITSTTLDIIILSGIIAVGDFIIANVENDTSIRHEILSVVGTGTIGLNTITIATPISVSANEAVAIEEAVPNRGDSYGAIAIGFSTASKGVGAIAIGSRASTDIPNQIAIGSDFTTVKLDGTVQDDTQNKVLVIDSSNIVKWRDASSIKPQVGFDTLDMLPDGWASANGNFNAYVKLDDTTTPVKNIKDMDWLVDGDRVVVIAENTKEGSNLADNAIQFPNWGASEQVINYASWNTPSNQAGPNLGYPTSELRFGDKIKFTAEMYQYVAGLRHMNWCHCVIYGNNQCPTGSNGSTTINEDESFSGSFNGIDDGYGSYGLTYEIVNSGSNGTAVLDNVNTGAFTYTPNADFFGIDTITWKVSDGYCESSEYSFVITVNAIDDAPVWTSTDPVTANTYPTLTGGDTWTYNWAVGDPDNPCANLTFIDQTIPSWLTFASNGDCTGTLSGTYPAEGGTYEVQLNVSDGTNTTSQSFLINGLTVNNDTYFVSWFDGSGSMNRTGRILSEISSTATVFAKSDGFGYGTNTLRLNPGTSNDVGMYVDDPSGDAYYGFQVLVVGMTVSGNGIPSGTTITAVTDTNDTSITLSNNHTTQVDDIITFARTDAQKAADYADINTFRNLLQDFYATGQTYAEETAAGVPHNSATNGQDRYDTHVKFGWDGYGAAGLERQIQYLANLGNPINTGAGQLFENASTVVVMGWGDESDGYYYIGGTGSLFSNKTLGNGLKVANDVAEVKQFITTSEDNAGSNQIYRGIWFSVANQTVYRQIGQGLQNGISPASQFGGNWTDDDLLTAQSSGSPTRIQYAGQAGDTDYPNGITAESNAAGYYRSVVLAKLQDSGFTTLN